jgi:hypothetical protein
MTCCGGMGNIKVVRSNSFAPLNTARISKKPAISLQPQSISRIIKQNQPGILKDKIAVNKICLMCSLPMTQEYAGNSKRKRLRCTKCLRIYAVQ